MEKSTNGADHWFAFSFWSVFFSTTLVAVVAFNLKYPPHESWFWFLNNQLWFTALDIILFLGILYIMVPILNKKDQKIYSELRGKYYYFSLVLNEKTLLPILAAHIFYIVLSFFIPLIIFILIIPLPFAISIYREKEKEKIKLPEQG